MGLSCLVNHPVFKLFKLFLIDYRLLLVLQQDNTVSMFIHSEQHLKIEITYLNILLFAMINNVINLLIILIFNIYI